MTDPFELAKLSSRHKHTAEQAAGAGAVGAIGATESRQAVKTYRQTKRGYRLSEAMPHQPADTFRHIKGISDAPTGTKITQASHPEGTYHVSVASLTPHRSKPSVVPSSNQRELARQVSRSGFTKPIHMKIYRDGAHVWDGGHRLNLADQLGHKSIPVHVEHVAGNKPKQVALSSQVNHVVQSRYRAKLVRSLAKSEGGHHGNRNHDSDCRNSGVFDHRDHSPFLIEKMSDAQLRRRKKYQAGLTTATATVGLAALGAKGGSTAVRRFVKPAVKAEKVANKIDQHTTTGLVIGSGVGGVAGFNSAAISRQESKRPRYPAHIQPTRVRKDWHSYDDQRRLLHRHGLRGAPQGVDRETRQQIWEARAKHLNRKRNRWERTGQGANAARIAGETTATGAGAIGVGAAIRDNYERENPGSVARGAAKLHHGLTQHISSRDASKAVRLVAHGKPGYRTLAVGVGGAAVGAGGRRLRAVANKKTRKYSSASGGIASGTARRMKDYDVHKSAFGVDHE